MSYVRLWRVEDEASSARYKRGQGICAGDDEAELHLYPNNPHYEALLREQFELHEDWSNTETTGLISTFDEISIACKEAKRRLERDRRGVVIRERELPDDCSFMRPAEDVAEALRCELPEKADSWIRNEMLFAHCITERWIKGYYKCSLKCGEYYNPR